MIRSFTFTAATAAVAISALPLVAHADQEPTYRGPQSVGETRFVHAVQTDLMKRFPTAKDAERAGYVRYTDEDSTGAISYANRNWNSSDVHHPSQLWYDAHGNLLGADYSVPVSGTARPQRWGVNPGRWYEFDGHVHYVSKDTRTGKLKYEQWVMNPQFAAAGGKVNDPSAQTLVKLHKVASANDVPTIFEFPKVWDLIVWVKPNPNGAFAEKNPLVKPTRRT